MCLTSAGPYVGVAASSLALKVRSQVFWRCCKNILGGRCMFLLNISFPLCIFLWKRLTSFWFLLSFQELTHAWIRGSDLNITLRVLTQFLARKMKVIYCRKDGGATEEGGLWNPGPFLVIPPQSFDVYLNIRIQPLLAVARHWQQSLGSSQNMENTMPSAKVMIGLCCFD